MSSGGDNPSTPNRMPNNSGFTWGGEDSAVAATIALNTALQLSGIQVEGFEYAWRVKNYNTTATYMQSQVDPFKITVDVKKADGRAGRPRFRPAVIKLVATTAIRGRQNLY